MLKCFLRLTKEIGQEISQVASSPLLPVLPLSWKASGQEAFQSSFLQYPVLKLVIKVMSALENYLYMNINCKFTVSQPMGEGSRFLMGISP